MTSQHSYVMTSLKKFRHFDFFLRILTKDLSKKYCGKFEVKWLKIKELAKAPKEIFLQNTFFAQNTTFAQTMTSSKIFRHFDFFFSDSDQG